MIQNILTKSQPLVNVVNDIVNYLSNLIWKIYTSDFWSVKS